MKRWPLRGQILFISVAVAALGCGIAGLLLDGATSRDLENRSREAARSRLAAAVELFGSGGSLITGSQIGFGGAPSPLAQALPRPGLVATLNDDAGSIWAAQRLESGEAIVVRFSTTEDARTLGRLRRNLAIATMLGILAAALAGQVLAAALTRRVRRAADVADLVPTGSATRFADDGRDEIGSLLRALDTMAERLQGTAARERRFASSVAHDLRTPIQALVSAGELLGETRPEQIVREQVRRLRHLTEDLLDVFRLDSGIDGIETEVVSSATLARACVQHSPVEAALVVGDPVDVVCDRRRVCRMIDNLLANAFHHGAPPIEVYVDGPCVVVRDRGPGLPDDVLAAGAKARGFGLPIVARQAALTKTTVTLRNRSGGGAEVTLRLQEAHTSPTAEHTGAERTGPARS